MFLAVCPKLGLTPQMEQGIPTYMSMLPWVVMAAASATVGYWDPLPQPGEVGYQSPPRHHARLLFENDAAFGRDQDYTHGTRLDYAQTLSPEHSASLSDAWGVSLTQNIYTPATHTNGAVWNEHPYGGYLAVGGAYMQRWHSFGHAVEVQVGTTGKPSFAENSQWFIHAVGNMDSWDGWGDQIDSEVTLQFSARQDVRLPWLEMPSRNGWQTDATFYLQEQVGTVSIHGGAGLVFRYGKNLPPSMQVMGNQPANFGVGLLLKEGYKPDAPSYFVLAGVYGGYVARDLFIDGGAFHPFEQTCSRKPWQVEGQLGVGVSYRGIDYYAGGVLHSRTYRSEGLNHAYGSFSITLHW